jgi:PAS domain S-box-containing protein
MRRPFSGFLTCVKFPRENRLHKAWTPMPASDTRQAAGKAGGLPAILGPVMALGGVAAVLALLAGLFDWRPNAALMAAVSVGAVIVLASLFVYRQLAERAAAARALENVEARVSGIVDSAMDAIVTVDENQHIVLFNAAAETVFGCPRDEAIGAPLAWFIPERFRAGHERHVRQFGETGTSSRRMGEQRIVMGLRRNGEEFPIEASISQITENGGKLYTVILRDVTARVRAQEALQRSREELRELAQASNSVREQEKSRIARELHDELAQALTALKMDVNWIVERLQHGRTEAAEEKLAGMQAMLDETLAATRRISADLRPLMLDDLGLVPAVEWLVQNFTERSGIHCNLALAEADELDLQEPHASAIFRILQESLTNVARHAHASQVEVVLRRVDGAVELKVRDDGRGFSTGDPRKPNSFGLMGLRERAYALGGTVNIDSRPAQGTRIEVRIPLAQQAALP